MPKRFPSRLHLAATILLCAVLLSSINSLAAGVRYDSPVVPGASPEAQSLLAYLSDIYGKRTLSGQQEGRRGTNGHSFELNYIEHLTGQLPAMIGLDVMHVPADARLGARANPNPVTRRAIEWSQRNGIVTVCWHWYAPMGARAFYTKDTGFDFRPALTAGTAEHEAVLKDIDAVSEELKILRDANVPVLWRPLHEANGRWFWWGAQGAEPCRQLWRMMFDRMTTTHQLTNLLWVFSPGASIDLADWYPGDAYVDIIGQDHYPMDGNNGPAKDIFDELTALVRNTKLVGMSENGPIPDPARMTSERANWLFFLTWAGTILTERNSKEQVIAAFNHPRVVNLSDLPDLKRYAFPQVSKPAKLAFDAEPGAAAVNGLRRSPLTVSVQDSNGRTVRGGSWDVTLRLRDRSGKARLEGETTQRTRNGVATFEDVRIDTAGDFRLEAAAAGLKSARSKAFETGPGSGIVAEVWNDIRVKSLSEIADLGKPAETRLMLKSFETPYQAATNMAVRYRGWLIPSQSGTHQFWIANEGISELWLSRGDDPAGRVLIAQVGPKTSYSKWPHTKEAESQTVNLKAGKRYYIEVLHCPAVSSHLVLSWRQPDGILQRPVPAERLARFDSREPRPKLARND